MAGSMETSIAERQRPASGPKVEIIVCTVSRQALERVDLEWLRQAKRWSPNESRGWPQEQRLLPG